MSEKTYELTGRRRMGKLRKIITTNVDMNDDNVHVRVELKSSKVKEYRFTKQDVLSTDFKVKFLWYTFDFVLMAFLVFLLLCGIVMGSFEIIFGVFIIAGLSYGLCARCQQLVIRLRSGSEVCIPVYDADEADEFLKELKQ